jgi:hypothetical protein
MKEKASLSLQTNSKNVNNRIERLVVVDTPSPCGACASRASRQVLAALRDTTNTGRRRRTFVQRAEWLVRYPCNPNPSQDFTTSTTKRIKAMDEKAQIPAETVEPAPAGVASRRPHRKSRRGCVQCKQRRIKVRDVCYWSLLHFCSSSCNHQLVLYKFPIPKPTYMPFVSLLSVDG